MAREGVLFRRAYSHSATTKPSHSSLFTSLYVMQHGVESNGLILDGEFQTMAEMMAAAGYRTAAFVSTDAPLGGNINQGFEHWDQFTAPDEPGMRSQYRPAAETVDAALHWLEGFDPDEKLFLWVHVYDPHRPMDPPQDEREAVHAMIESLGEDNYDAMLIERDIPVERSRVYDEVVDYNAEVLYADTEIGRLFASMDESGLNRRSMWVITGDHGQGLGAHDWFGHSVQIYNAQLHVPLLFWFSEVRQPREVSRVVEHVDVLPTIAEITGGRLEQIMPIQGKSLVPDLEGRRQMDAKWFSFAERSRYANPSDRRQEKGNYEPGARYALQDQRFKYQLFTEGDDEFYDLEADPYERVNLIDAEEYVVDRDQMLEFLVDLIQNLPRGREAQAVSPEEVERLRALGYIQ
jgi:arylsulfatase A-like enzyme